jgi:hypothetical protein
MIAESREKARRDYQARLEGAEEKGIKIGEARGEIRGEARGEARAYKKMGVSVTDIAAKTGLSIEEIERL